MVLFWWFLINHIVWPINLVCSSLTISFPLIVCLIFNWIMSSNLLSVHKNFCNYIFSATAVVYDSRLSLHYSAWNQDFTEIPQRNSQCIERCSELGLLQRCFRVPVSCTVLFDWKPLILLPNKTEKYLLIWKHSSKIKVPQCLCCHYVYVCVCMRHRYSLHRLS